MFEYVETFTIHLELGDNVPDDTILAAPKTATVTIKDKGTLTYIQHMHTYYTYYTCMHMHNYTLTCKCIKCTLTNPLTLKYELL